jgi:hypothetical protein
MNRCAVWFILWPRNGGFRPKPGHRMDSTPISSILWPANGIQSTRILQAKAARQLCIGNELPAEGTGTFLIASGLFFLKKPFVTSNFESTFFGKGKSTDFGKVKSTP